MRVTDPFVTLQVGQLVMTCIEDTAGFRALEQDWRDLHRDCPALTPFNSWEWLFSWWQAYGEGKRLRLLTWRLNGGLVAVAPLYLTSEKATLGISVSVLRLVGDGTFDSDHLAVLIRPGFLSIVAEQLGDWLMRRTVWDALALRELSPGSELPHALCDMAHHRGFAVRLERGRCGVLALPSTFEEFLQTRQARFRTKLRALMRKLDEGSVIFETAPATAQLRKRLRSLFRLHQQRWQAVGEGGIFDQRAKRVFYAHFVPRFARRGWLRFYSLRDRESYVAHQLCFGLEGTTYLLQEGFDVTNRSASYGQMLRAAVMRDLIERGERQYDFLGGFSNHKEAWGAKEQAPVHVVIGRPRLFGWLYINAPLWRERCAEVAKRLLPASMVRAVRRSGVLEA